MRKTSVCMNLSWISTATWSADGRRGWRQSGPQSTGQRRGTGSPGPGLAGLVPSQLPTGHRAQTARVGSPGVGGLAGRPLVHTQPQSAQRRPQISARVSAPRAPCSQALSLRVPGCLGRVPARPLHITVWSHRASQLPSTGPEGSGHKGLAPALAHFHSLAPGDSPTRVELHGVGEGFCTDASTQGPAPGGAETGQKCLEGPRSSPRSRHGAQPARLWRPEPQPPSLCLPHPGRGHLPLPPPQPTPLGPGHRKDPTV